MTRVFVDTSGWYAHLNRDQSGHAAIKAALKAHHGRLVTSNFVVDETLTLIRSRMSWHHAHAFGVEIRAGGLAELIRVEPADEDAAWAIFVRYRDHVFSFTDCTSFALMQRLGLSTAIVLDDDFRTFGLTCLP